ncbi:MAG TPA: 3-keto-5-aminohexanoate cleavage protein, partial [Mycobacteriales bacterium]|nr:3-keto-5-aminohexanoate cleavage protein [Mycobacteriales bacterium]
PDAVHPPRLRVTSARTPAAGTLITVAPTGAETEASRAPGLPVTLQSLVETARACQAAGAAVIHVHLRDDDGVSTLDVGRLRAAVEALRGSTDLIVQLSTGGAVTDSEADRLRVLDAEPDSASLTCGTVNFGDDVFLNRRPFVEELYTRMQERGIAPEFECFDAGHVTTVSWLLDKHGPPYGGHVHVDLVLGVPGGLPGTARALADAVAALPDGATFSATGVGRAHLTVMLAALAHGGNLRVGMEDTLTFAAGEPVRDNAQLVARAATLATLAQRPPLAPAAARELLGLSARSR